MRSAAGCSNIRIRVYSDLTFLPEGVPPVLLIAPLVGGGTVVEGPRVPWRQYCGCEDPSFGRYWRIASELFELSPLEDCDVAVMPADWISVGGLEWRKRPRRTHLRRCGEFAERVRAAGKPLVLFARGDLSHEPIPIPADCIYRNSIYRGHRRTVDRSLPYFAEDFLGTYFEGRPQPRPWTAKPVVGFCGYAERSTLRQAVGSLAFHARTVLRHRCDFPSPYEVGPVRAHALERLADDRSLATCFDVYDERVAYTVSDRSAWLDNRRTYVANLAASDYVLCTRGIGNYSARLYEALSCGRIPVILDRGAVLPFESELDWDSLAVRVPEQEPERLGERIRAFHESLGPAGFEDLQRRCRWVWEHYLSAEGFYRHLAAELEARAARRADSQALAARAARRPAGPPRLVRSGQ